MAWHFFVQHYRNETQGMRDSKFTYLLEDGSWYTGLNPPENSEPYVNIYQHVECLLILSSFLKARNILPARRHRRWEHAGQCSKLCRVLG